VAVTQPAPGVGSTENTEEKSAKAPEKQPQPEWQDGGIFGKALVLTEDTELKYGDVANFEKENAFSVAAWVKIPRD
jgi:hypothetical protein